MAICSGSLLHHSFLFAISRANGNFCEGYTMNKYSKLVGKAVLFILSASLVFVLTGCDQVEEPLCEPFAETAPVAKIPGTNWEGCDGECKWVKRENNTYKCVKKSCPKNCQCRVFSRPTKNWDGDREDEGDWSEDAKEREADMRYRCWCVK